MKILIVISLINCLFVSSLFSQKTPTLENLQAEIGQIIHWVKHSVVTVSAKSCHYYTIGKSGGLLSLFKNNKEEKKDNFWTVGSGVIYNQEGYIITRSSILADFEAIKITLCNGKEFEAEYIGTDENTGLAILKIDDKNLEPTLIGNSDQLSLYSFVMVLGNSMGISPFASFGLVNGFTEDRQFILSASINPGNIGGAVFNLKGEIIGIITAKVEAEISMTAPNYLDYSQQSSIAIPINQVAQMIERVIAMHHQQKNWLGIMFEEDSLKKNKLVLKSVIPGSPAAHVGLRPGDYLTKYNESDIYDLDVFCRLIEQTKSGTTVSINFIRNNKALKVIPLIEQKWPMGFNTQKPRHLSPLMMRSYNKSVINSPITISPDKFQEIHTRMIQMEGEIKSLKSLINK
jgi:S1-C subfamily serine protease